MLGFLDVKKHLNRRKVFDKRAKDASNSAYLLGGLRKKKEVSCRSHVHRQIKEAEITFALARIEISARIPAPTRARNARIGFSTTNCNTPT